MIFKVIYLDSKDEERQLKTNSEAEAIRVKRELRKKGAAYVEIIQLDKRYTPPKKYKEGNMDKRGSGFDKYHIRGTLADIMK
nr:MAG TPA: hypothetical protein [Caudoviricetes sp.]